MTAIALDLHSIVDLTDRQFYQLCQISELTQSQRGVMPTNWLEDGNRNTKLTQRFGKLD